MYLLCPMDEVKALSCTGPGDMLALFRCLSCKYSFSTDLKNLAVMGAPGRVFTTGEVGSFPFSVKMQGNHQHKQSPLTKPGTAWTRE